MSNLKHGIAWDDSLKTGHEMVDSQHFKLFELLSNIVGARTDSDGQADMNDTLSFLVDYTIKHFQDEEALQMSCGYPDYERHKQLHENFALTVKGLVQRYEESGSTDELNSDVNRIIVRWLLNHINLEDKKIGKYIRGGKD